MEKPERPRRPRSDADASEIAAWMDQSFGWALAAAMEETDHDDDE